MTYDEFQGHPKNEESKIQFLLTAIDDFDNYLSEIDPNSFEYDDALMVLCDLMRLKHGKRQQVFDRCLPFNPDL